MAPLILNRFQGEPNGEFLIHSFSFTPGFSLVLHSPLRPSRFNGFAARAESR
jgi:hypothetical protein